MKKLLFFICLIVLCVCQCVFADDSSSSNANWGIAPVSDDETAAEAGDEDSQGTDDFYYEEIYDEYGSNQSPAFNNREKINPNESDYGFGQADGYQ